MTRVLVIDNRDSFVHTIDGYLRELGAETVEARNDVVPDSEVAALLADFDAVLISPGPGAPADAGISAAVVRAALPMRMPVLGVCLGHQVIAEVFGARVSQAAELMHGRTSSIEHTGDGLYAGLGSPFVAARYHSLAVEVESIPPALVVTATTADGLVMGVRHRDARIDGVQFHPESVLTEGGYRVLGNWLESAGCSGAAVRARTLAPHTAVDVYREVHAPGSTA